MVPYSLMVWFINYFHDLIQTFFSMGEGGRGGGGGGGGGESTKEHEEYIKPVTQQRSITFS